MKLCKRFRVLKLTLAFVYVVTALNLPNAQAAPLTEEVPQPRPEARVVIKFQKHPNTQFEGIIGQDNRIRFQSVIDGKTNAIGPAEGMELQNLQDIAKRANRTKWTKRLLLIPAGAACGVPLGAGVAVFSLQDLVSTMSASMQDTVRESAQHRYEAQDLGLAGQMVTMPIQILGAMMSSVFTNIAVSILFMIELMIYGSIGAMGGGAGSWFLYHKYTLPQGKIQKVASSMNEMASKAIASGHFTFEITISNSPEEYIRIMTQALAQ